MKTIYNLFLATLTFALFTSCEYFVEEEEVEPLKSTIDGDQYVQDMTMEINSRKDTRMIEDGFAADVSYESKLNIVDSLSSSDSLWRSRYFGAANDQWHLILESDYERVSINTFKLFLYYPQELISHFDSISMGDIDFWNSRLSEEIKYNCSLEGITEESIIAMAQDNCKDCSESTMKLIEQMVLTLKND